jgi:hypothetical protein
LRRAAWYGVLSLGPDAAVVGARHEPVIVPRAYLEIVNTRPTTWTMVVEERYAVCPNCAHRVAVGLTREPMSCGRCDGVFGFELHSMEEIELRHEASWRRETP